MNLSSKLRCCTLALLATLTCQAEDSATTPSFKKGTTYPLYILAGQSNMDGRAKARDLKGPLASFATPQEQVWIRTSSGGLKRPLSALPQFEFLRPGNSLTLAQTPPGKIQFGPELSLGTELSQHHQGQTILFVKVAEGGTNLAKDWAPEAPNKLYRRLLDYVESSRALVRQNGAESELKAVFWMQGESDDQSTTEVYTRQLAQFIVKLRADLKQPALPFIIGEVCDNGKRNTILEAQSQIARTTPHCALVPSRKLATFDQGTHFDAASQIELGRGFAKAYLSLPKK